MNRNKYHQHWRNKNRVHVNEFSRDYVKNNSEQRRKTTKQYRNSIKDDKIHFIKQLVRTSVQSARKKNIEHSINFDLILIWINLQNDKCAVTGIQFDYVSDKNFRSRPYAPSIDRRDNAKGYTPDNIQLVCCIVNRAKNEFTQEMFDQMCIARVRQITNEKA